MGKKDSDVRLTGQALREMAAKRLAAQKPSRVPVTLNGAPIIKGDGHPITAGEIVACEVVTVELPEFGAVDVNEAGRAVKAYRKYREKMKLKMRKRRSAGKE